MLAPILCLLYIDYLDDNISLTNELNLLKVQNILNLNNSDKHVLQDDLAKLIKWCKNSTCYLMLGNVDVYIGNGTAKQFKRHLNVPQGRLSLISSLIITV